MTDQARILCYTLTADNDGERKDSAGESTGHGTHVTENPHDHPHKYRKVDEMPSGQNMTNIYEITLLHKIFSLISMSLRIKPIFLTRALQKAVPS